MATEKSVGNPLGKDNKPGSEAQVDAKEYVMYVVESTKHWFYAPEDKYKGIAKALGLKKVSPNSKDAAGSVKLAAGQGYIRLGAKLDNGATLMVICDPQKIGSAIGAGTKEGGGENDKIYGVGVRRLYIPKKRVLI